MFRRSGLTSLVFSILLLFTLSAQSADPARVQPAATSYIVSGSVTAPGGVIAGHGHAEGFSLARLLDFFIPPAQAGISGLLPVPNGTRVELVRIGDRGFTSAPLAVTTTQYGRYRFNLTTLRLTVSSRLIVRVGNVGTGGLLRAFVSGSTVDINPVSEAAVHMVLHSIAASQDRTLLNFTVRELQDLTGSLDLLASINGMTAAVNILSSVAEVRTTAAADAGIMRFLAAAAYPGQTNIGPGDIGNFFPFTRGLSWTYTVQETEDGIARPPYTTTGTITGTRLINGVATTVFRDSNPDGDGRVGYDFNKKTTAGVFDWEPVKDRQMNRPHQFVRFPAVPGSTFSQSLGGMFDTDIDRDGIVERFGLRVTTTVVGLGTVYVPASALPNTLKIRSVITGGATVSSTGKRITLNITAIEWYTRNLGLSKQTLNSRASYDGMIWRDTRAVQLTEASGFPFTGEFPLDRWTTMNIESNDIAYDKVGGKLFASVPIDAVNYANNIIVIDPNSARVVASILMSGEPGPLAVSDDGQFLYAGLRGASGAIAQISIPNLSVEAIWTLSTTPGTAGAPRHPYNLAVQPGQSQVVVVSTEAPGISGGVVSRGTLVLDAGVERADFIGIGTGPNVIHFSDDPTVAYGYNVQWDTSTLTVLSVDAEGISISDSRSDLFDPQFNSLTYAGGRIYTDNGEVFDAQSANLLGVYSLNYPDYCQAEPNIGLDQATFVTKFIDAIYLEIFDTTTYSKADETVVPVNSEDYPTHLERFDANGYVMRILDSYPSYDMSSHLLLVKKAHPN